ncbi:RNA polymerase sigma factor [Pedobacter panaciterrae]|uniref:RNA polymerase sigma-70 factor n=2 Tax=Pedobacter panaciterrae TaxID=363849 RepID=A0ABU8NMQ1_9SPHI|nr:RNA polymerase sigma-70 factor [uncultured Pedobacter sp.]
MTKYRVMPVELSDAELILLWQNGADNAFEVLYKRYAVGLLSAALSKTRSRELSEEIIQETFLTLFTRKKTANQIINLSAFLYTIVKHKIIDHYRREKLLKRYEEHSSHIFTETDNSTLQTIESKELEQQLIFQIEKLPLRCRSVFNLSRNHHLTNKEIASELHISENTVEQHMRKALRLLRSYFFGHTERIIIFCLFVLSLF